MAKCLLFILMLFSANVGAQVQSVKQNENESKKYTVYVFLSETCPACQSYTLKLKELFEKYQTKGISFLAVFPNYFSSDSTIQSFKKEYALPFNCISDKQNRVTKQFGAKITPEVFLATSYGNVLYSGRIDDSFYKVGKRRKVISSNELEEAIVASINGTSIFNKRTQAVGCLISLKENK